MAQAGRFCADGRSVRRATLVLTAVLLVSGGLTACDASKPTANPDPVRIGALYPLTGRSSPSGTGMAAAAKLAVAEANAEGGVLGRKIQLEISDDACDPGSAVTGANTLVGKRIAASVGGYCSSATVPTLKIFHTAGVPMIIPSANSTDLLAPAYKDVFLLSGTTTDEARFALQAIQRSGARRLSVISDGTSYSAALAAASVAPPALGGTGVSVAGRLTVSQGAPSYRRIADDVRSSGADAVYYTGYYADAAQLVSDLRDAGYRGKIFVADGCIDGDLLQRLTPEQSEGIYGTALQVPSFVPAAANWAARFKKANGSPPGQNTMEAYDAVRLALDAIKRAGSTDPAKVRDAIAGTTDLRMLTGPVRFKPDGSRDTPTFLLLRASNGQFGLTS
jgi:branched-chain amino acid transport system substrate-binding protein